MVPVKETTQSYNALALISSIEAFRRGPSFRRNPLWNPEGMTDATGSLEVFQPLMREDAEPLTQLPLPINRNMKSGILQRREIRLKVLALQGCGQAVNDSSLSEVPYGACLVSHRPPWFAAAMRYAAGQPPLTVPLFLAPLLDASLLPWVGVFLLPWPRRSRPCGVRQDHAEFQRPFPNGHSGTA